jgi:hypothetical protein
LLISCNGGANTPRDATGNFFFLGNRNEGGMPEICSVLALEGRVALVSQREYVRERETERQRETERESRVVRVSLRKL